MKAQFIAYARCSTCKKAQKWLEENNIKYVDELYISEIVRTSRGVKIDFSIKAEIILYQDADITSVQTTLDSKLQEYKKTLAQKLGKNVVKSQIKNVLSSIYGVYDIRSLTPENIDIEKYQWANLVDYDVKIGGYADEWFSSYKRH